MSEPLISGTYPENVESAESTIQTVLEETPHGSRATLVPATAVVPTPAHRPLSTP